MNEIEIENRLTTVEQATKSAHHRLDTIERIQGEIRDLTLSVNSLAMSVKGLCEDVTDITGRVKEIEAKPAKRMDQIAGQIISILLAAAFGYILKGA